MNKEKIVELTYEYGGDWAVQHAERLIHLVALIGGGLEFDSDVIWLAAYLHDWGGYEKWTVPGVWHADRSREVAEEFLAEQGMSEEMKKVVLDCIQYHHGGPEDRCIESVLLTDADALDLLGALGMLRIFAMNPRNLKGGYEAAKKFRDMSTAAITLDKSHTIAADRIKETDNILELFEKESFGIF
ncbi:HD domain-containing protein [bacterium]|nr:HD domain-containing protein [bacterium]